MPPDRGNCERKGRRPDERPKNGGEDEPHKGGAADHADGRSRCDKMWEPNRGEDAITPIAASRAFPERCETTRDGSTILLSAPAFGR